MSEWPSVPFGRIAKKLVNGGTPPTDVPRYWIGQIPWVTGADFTPAGIGEFRRFVSDEAIRETSTNVIEEGQLLLVTRTGVGKLAIAPCDIAISQDVTGVYADDEQVDTAFLFHRMRQGVEDLKKLNQGTSINGIIRSDLVSYLVKLPSLPQQRRIAEILSTLDEAIEQTEALIAKMQQVKAGLMHDLFSRGVTLDGRLRPMREQAPELYKESPLGWIPKEWEVVELHDEIGIAHGFAFSGEFFSDTPPGEVLLTPGNFHRDGGLYFTDENTKYFQGQIPPTTVLHNGEMVIVMTDLSPQTLILGRFAIVEMPFPLLHNQRIGRIMLKRKDRWDWSYLCNALNDERIRRKIIVEATGTTVRHTSPNRILGNRVARPPLDEQRKSIEVLRSIEQRLLNERASHLKCTQLKNGLMHDLLTGKISCS